MAKIKILFREYVKAKYNFSEYNDNTINYRIVLLRNVQML